MKIVITGATGNVGTSLLETLAQDSAVDELLGLARRKPNVSFEKTRFVSVDVAKDDLVPHLAGADAVVHLAWMIQPIPKEKLLEAVNVEGSRRVFEATIAAGVPSLVYASSVGTYAASTKDHPVDESWSTAGIPSSLYSRQKAYVERQLDGVEREHPELRIVRMRPGLTFKRGSASEMHRYFLGRLVPSWLLDKRFIPVVPDIPQLRFQGVHTRDVAQAYRLALLSDVRGAFNLAADPVLDPDVLAKLFRARKVRIKARTLRRLLNVTYRLRLQPSSPGLLDMALQIPIMDVSRANEVLRWRPSMSSTEALMEVFEGIGDKAGMRTGPLEPARQLS
jgi:UDP-glucose 4-epimerase